MITLYQDHRGFTVERIVKHMKLNTGLDIPVQSVTGVEKVNRSIPKRPKKLIS